MRRIEADEWFAELAYACRYASFASVNAYFNISECMQSNSEAYRGVYLCFVVPDDATHCK